MISTTFSNRSAIHDTDLILIERSGVSYKVETQYILDFIEDDDLFLVSRGGISYKCAYKDIDAAPNTDLVLVTRGTKSYHITVAEVRGIFIPDITFELRLTSPAWSSKYKDGGDASDGLLCSRLGNANPVYAKGGIVTATITASGNSTYSFDIIPGGSSKYPQMFSINGEWIAVVGNASAFALEQTPFCLSAIDSNDALGFSDPGNNVPGPDGPVSALGTGNPFLDSSPGVGGGCPRGAISRDWTSNLASDAGYSQYRTRGENISGNVWNEVTIDNPKWEPNENYPPLITGQSYDAGQDLSITFNGITKQYFVPSSGNSITDLPLSGTLAEFLEWT